MGLFERMSRVVRANRNNFDREGLKDNSREGAAFVTGGAAAGAGVSATVGGMGLVAGGAGAGIGMAPVAAAGAIAGVAAYGAKKAIEDGDASALGAAALGAAGGAGVSAAVGGMGLAVGGTAIGVGMVPIAAAGAVVGLGAYGLNRLLQQDADPEKLLELAIIEMQEALLHLRQAVVKATAVQKRTEQQYNKNQTEANNWQQRAQLAFQKGDENLAREALIRKKSNADTAAILKEQLVQQTAQVETLKRNSIALESKVAEAKTKKNMLKARAAAAQANERLQSTISSLNTGGSMAAFERMEEKVLMMEAKSQAAGELAGADLESQFAKLEAGSDVDDELAAMKAQLTGGAISQQ